MGQSQLSRDSKNFDSLFMDLANRVGPKMIICGMQPERDELLDTFDFLFIGYRLLNKNFEHLDPPLRQQVLVRNNVGMSVELSGHGQKTPYDEKKCKNEIMPSAKLLIGKFQSTAKGMERRLRNAGYNPSDFKLPKQHYPSPSEQCPENVSYYRKGVEYEDYLCAQIALRREQGLDY